MHDFLTDQEKAKIVQFNEDEVMKEAVRKVFLKVMYSQGTLRKDMPSDPLNNGALGLAFQSIRWSALSDEQLGADLRGLSHGINLLESGFQELDKVEKPEPEPEPEDNPAV